MVVQTTYKCDICKKEFTLDAQNYGIGHISVDYMLKNEKADDYEQQATSPLDLCPDCTRKLKMFLANQF